MAHARQAGICVPLPARPTRPGSSPLAGPTGISAAIERTLPPPRKPDSQAERGTHQESDSPRMTVGTAEPARRSRRLQS